jgi:hypothetical protein
MAVWLGGFRRRDGALRGSKNGSDEERVVGSHTGWLAVG